MSENETGKDSCFVIMPITVPDHLVDRYGGRHDHFVQIFNSLIRPAVEMAGLEAKEPKREGSENIQAGIINDLRTADIVLADLSALNPNVFLELGIRSALDGPVCLVWDSLDSLPFDTATIHTHDYNSSPVYELNEEIMRLSDHIKATLERSDGRNELWKFFGSASSSDLPAAVLNPADASADAKLDRLLQLAERPLRPSLQPKSDSVVASATSAGRFRVTDLGEALGETAIRITDRRSRRSSQVYSSTFRSDDGGYLTLAELESRLVYILNSEGWDLDQSDDDDLPGLTLAVGRILSPPFEAPF